MDMVSKPGVAEVTVHHGTNAQYTQIYREMCVSGESSFCQKHQPQSCDWKKGSTPS